VKMSVITMPAMKLDSLRFLVHLTVKKRTDHRVSSLLIISITPGPFNSNCSVVITTVAMKLNLLILTD
jgi:hypothetical protein